MIAESTTISSWLSAYEELNADIFNFTLLKPMVDEWVEANIRLPKHVSVYPGNYSYNWTPYWREPVNHLHTSSAIRTVSIMKSAQNGATQGIVVPALLYIISQIPENTLFTASDIALAAKTIEERIDPIIRESGMESLIRPNVVKKTNNRTGDTSKKKEFRGGTLTALGTSSANSFRMFSARYVFADDYDTAPRDLGDEGSVKSLIQGRQNSFGGKAKTYFISTPRETNTSNIWEQFQLGTQKKWHWPCPHCEQWMPMDWKITREDGSLAGMVWELDDEKRLIPSSVHFRCPHCGGRVDEKDKYDLNLLGKWIAGTDKPVEARHESYCINGIVTPPGFTGWVDLVQEWLTACPPGERVSVRLLKAFNNVRLGLPFEDVGAAPRVNELMENTRTYAPGIVPDKTCEADGNGRIVMLTLSCDINGLMEPDNEDVRIDWEILAHTSRGPSYSVDHGSIGTFKRKRDALNGNKNPEEAARMKWTLVPNSRAKNEMGEIVNNSVWPEIQELVKKIYPLESYLAIHSPLTIDHSQNDHAQGRSINLTMVDSGFGERYVMPFVKQMQQLGLWVYGIKGREEDNYRKTQKDANPVIRSKENPRELYIIEVNQVKDDLAEMMKLRPGEDGSQPYGFMNFPQPNQGKYTMEAFFRHYESERRTEVMGKNGEPIGYKWVKKHSGVQNHFWDVRVYGLCGPLIMVDLVRQSDSKYKLATWDDVVAMLL